MVLMTVETVRNAAQLLGISNHANLYEIKQKYRTRCKEWHPDVSNMHSPDSHELFISLQEAYEILTEYCMHYKISFRIEDLMHDINKVTMDGGMERFRDDPIWGR